MISYRCKCGSSKFYLNKMSKLDASDYAPGEMFDFAIVDDIIVRGTAGQEWLECVDCHEDAEFDNRGKPTLLSTLTIHDLSNNDEEAIDYATEISDIDAKD